MKSWKTTVAGLVAGLPTLIDALITAYNAGQFTGKTTAQTLAGIGIVILGLIAKDHNVTGGTVAKIMLPIILVLGLTTANAQSMFKPLPKIAHSYGATFYKATTSLPDSTFTGFRFSGPMVLYALPNSTIFTGVGISYEHDTYNLSTSKWYTNWSVALGGYEGGQIAPANISAVTAVGLSVAFFNKLLTVGILYNITNRNFQGAVGPQVSLNN